MGYGKRSNICVTGAPEGKESKQKQYIGDTGRDFSKTNKRCKSEIQGALLISRRINNKKPYLSNYNKTTESKDKEKILPKKHITFKGPAVKLSEMI